MTGNNNIEIKMTFEQLKEGLLSCILEELEEIKEQCDFLIKSLK